jgi:hypothetical protein
LAGAVFLLEIHERGSPVPANLRGNHL